MVRFSVGEEEEESMAVRNKRRRLQRTEGEIENEGAKFGENEEKIEEELGQVERGGEENTVGSCGAISVTVDPDVLECIICCEPLLPPLFQVRI